VSADFNQTWTILNDIKSTLTACCTDLKATISADFNQTWTILSDLKKTVIKCCDDLVLDTTLLKIALCNPISINQSDILNTTFTINAPGLYIFAEDIIFSPASGQPAIEIIENGVTVDLCGKSLTQGNVTLGVDGIRIVGGPSANPRVDVTVKNGSIKGFSAAGLSIGKNTNIPINTSSSRLLIDSIDIVACANRGVEMVASGGSNLITQSILKNCRILQSCTSPISDFGVYLLYTQDIKIQDSFIDQNSLLSNNFSALVIEQSIKPCIEQVQIRDNNGRNVNGCVLINTEGGLLNSCSILNNAGINAFSGFILNGASEGNLLTSCLVNNNTSQGQTIGYAFQVGSIRNVAIDCLSVNNVSTGTTANSNCYGFSFDQVSYSALLKCRAMYNRAGGLSSGTNIAAGFNISTSGISGTGCKNCEFNLCQAVSNSGFDDKRSYGIRPFSAKNGNENNVYISCAGIRNGTSSPLNQNQIVTTAGLGSNPGGVPNASVKASSFTNLNGTSIEYGNIIIY
jgi:hypothetical protein